MAGASNETQRVRYVNANWSPGSSGDAGFDVLVVTEDGERTSLPVPADEMTALVALTQAAGVLLWDPVNRALICANLVGEWIKPSWSAGDDRA
ncbi:hypothetical protein [uncultured Jatrophihabitans sp.]|uniref:hypothetical protein n=1 Tax=uncultured Jatrophihabitans sp. TaxID=1610747 RepID=UPI0035C97AD9